jgi:glycerol-3-phosphate dehydrogenase
MAIQLLTAPPQRVNWPPYVPTFINTVSNWIEPDEVLCSDMPWATAWYGGRVSLLLPATVKQFITIHDYKYLGGPVNGLYLTPVSGDRPWISGIAKGDYREWATFIMRTADLSRRHKVFASDNGVITVTGGKLTTYREMAEDAVDEACSLLGVKKHSKTKALQLRGATGKRVTATHFDRQLDGRYGSDSAAIKALIAGDATLGEALVPGLPYIKAEAVYAVTHEMATTLDDVLTRRTRARLLDRKACARAAGDIANLMAPLLQWDTATRDRNLAQFIDECAREDAAALVTEAEFIASSTPGTEHQ